MAGDMTIQDRYGMMVWHSGTKGSNPRHLIMQNNGNLELHRYETHAQCVQRLASAILQL
jgi:hypothetical protein